MVDHCNFTITIAAAGWGEGTRQNPVDAHDWGFVAWRALTSKDEVADATYENSCKYSEIGSKANHTIHQIHPSRTVWRQ